jgi:hypothetical protein
MSVTRRVLFVAYGGGHIPMVLSVMRALRSLQPDIHIDLIALTTAYAAAKAAGEKPWQYADLKHLIDLEFADKWGAELAPKSRHPTISDEETQAYAGVNFWDLTQQLGLEAASELHKKKERFAYFPIYFFKRVIEHFKPNVVVATVSPRSEEAALQAAIEKKIPSLSMTDFYLRSFDPYCNRKYYADRVTVVNSQVRNTLEECGVNKDSILTTGNPAFDSLLDVERLTQAQAWRDSLVWKNKTVVLWAGHLDDYTSITPDIESATSYPLQVEAQLRDWVDENEDRALIIRYHPNEMHLFKAGAAHPRIFLSMREQHVHEAILAADLVVVQMSTVGLEAAVAGKPVIAMVNSPHCKRVDFNYQKLGVAYACEEIGHLSEEIAHALKGGCISSELILKAPCAPTIALEILDLASKIRPL